MKTAKNRTGERLAVIRNITQGTSNVSPHKSMVDATVQVVESAELGKLIHLATYGSDSRQSEPKVSQTIQFDKKMAMQLGKIIEETFGPII